MITDIIFKLSVSYNQQVYNHNWKIVLVLQTIVCHIYITMETDTEKYQKGKILYRYQFQCYCWYSWYQIVKQNGDFSVNDLYYKYELQGRIQDFKLGGAHLKKLRRAEVGAKMFGVFRVENHDFTPKNHIFFQF